MDLFREDKSILEKINLVLCVRVEQVKIGTRFVFDVSKKTDRKEQRQLGNTTVFGIALDGNFNFLYKHMEDYAGLHRMFIFWLILNLKLTIKTDINKVKIVETKEQLFIGHNN